MSGTAKLTLLLELRNRLKAGMGQAREYLSKNVNSMKAKIGELRAAHGEAFQAMADQVPGLGNALSLLTNPYALATAAVLTLGAAYGKAMGLSNQWKNSLAKANVTAQLSQEELGKLSGQLLTIGRRNVVDLMEVPEAFNTIISAGLDTNTALKTLEPTLKAAKAGFTDIKTVADAAVSTMNSSGVTDATHVYDVLFATLNKGKAEFVDIANYLPKIIPGARQAGFELEQTAGTFAFLTLAGLRAEAASTALSNAFKALSTPDIIYGSKTKGGFKALGVDIFDATGKMKSMVQIASSLNTVMSGLTDEQRIKKFASIGLDMEAATAFNLMSQNVDKLKDSIDFTTNSTGQLNEAVENAKQPMDSWKILGNEIKATMIELGSTGVEWFGLIGDKILAGVNYMKNLYDESTLFRDIITVIGFVAEEVWSRITFVVRTVWAILTAVWNTITQIKTAIFGAGDGFENMYLRVKPYILWIYQYLSGVASILKDVATFDFDSAKDNIEKLINAKSIQQLRVDVVNEAAENKKRIADEKTTPELAPGGGLKNPPTAAPSTATTPELAPGGGGSASKVTGMQSQPRNITFNMDAMFKMGDWVTKNAEMASMSKRELETWFQEMTIRMIRNIETSYS